MESLIERSQKKLMITAHGGYNVDGCTFNSMKSFERAVTAGADIIELDVCRSAEGKLYVFHAGMEKRFLGYDCDVTKMSNAEIEAQMNAVSKLPIPSLDDVFEAFRGRCYINTDKAYSCFPELVESIRRHGIMEQIILKGEVNNVAVYDMTEELAPDIPFIAMSYEVDTAIDVCRGRNINYIGSEVIFTNDNAPVAQDEYIEMMHRNGKLIWVNTLYIPTRSIVGGHHDRRAADGDPDGSWGWLADKGFDILQTDMAGELTEYLTKTNKMYKFCYHATDD